MRPPKNILIVDANISSLSVYSFLFRINHYRVFATESPEEAVTLFCGTCIDLVLIDQGIGTDLVLKLKKIASHIPMVVLGNPKMMNGIAHGADALLNKRMCSSAELLERVKIMSARKRGPRKGINKPIVQSAPESVRGLNENESRTVKVAG